MEFSNSSKESSNDHPGLLPNRACRNCVQIKAKCVPHEERTTTTCQRCHRLGKICATPMPVARRRPLPRKSQIANLGVQQAPTIDHVSGGQFDDNAGFLTPPVSNGSGISSSSRVCVQGHGVHLSAQEIIPWGRPSKTSSVNAISPEICHPFATISHEQYFELFKTSLSQHFPFVVIPPNTTAASFSKERPFLYTACVMAGAHRNPPFQSRVARDMLRYVGKRIIQAGDKSLDLLQGLMVAVAWYHVYSHGNPQLMNLLHLAKALMIDLGLNRSPGSGLYQIKMSSDAQSMLHGIDVNGPKHTIEQRRIHLSVYQVSSKFHACFRRMDEMRWNDYLEDCCEYLETTPEFPSDQYAASLVRLDHIIERYTGSEGVKPGKTMPLQAFIRLFTYDIDQLVEKLPSWLREDTMMTMHLQNAELCLYELVIGSEADTPAHKVEALHACLSKVINFFENTFLKLSVDHLVSIPFLVWAPVAHALDVLAKLSFTTVTGWDAECARHNPGFIGITDKLIVKLRETFAAEQSYPDNISTRFKAFAEKLQWCQQWYRSKLEADTRRNEEFIESTQGTDFSLPDVELSSYPYFGEFSDMLWQDFINDWPTRTDMESRTGFQHT